MSLPLPPFSLSRSSSRLARRETRALLRVFKAAAAPAKGGFNASKHPRWPAGHPCGGQFRPKIGVGANGQDLFMPVFNGTPKTIQSYEQALTTIAADLAQGQVDSAFKILNHEVSSNTFNQKKLKASVEELVAGAVAGGLKLPDADPIGEPPKVANLSNPQYQAKIDKLYAAVKAGDVTALDAFIPLQQAKVDLAKLKAKPNQHDAWNQQLLDAALTLKTKVDAKNAPPKTDADAVVPKAPDAPTTKPALTPEAVTTAIPAMAPDAATLAAAHGVFSTPPKIATQTNGQYQKKADALHAAALAGDTALIDHTVAALQTKLAGVTSKPKPTQHEAWNLQVLAYAEKLQAEAKAKADNGLPSAAPKSALTQGPLSLAAMTYVAGKPDGSNPGGIHADAEGGSWLIKGSLNPDPEGAPAKNEVLAARLYNAAGAHAPEMRLVDLGDQYGGGIGVASKMQDGFKPLDPINPAHLAKVREDFAVDAWLANWDSVGLSFDNTVIDKNGQALRIDPGGALLFRAQGAPKGTAFGKSVTEWDTLRDPAKNPQAGKVFAGMTQAELQASAQKVAAISDATIERMVKRYGPGDDVAKADLTATLIARKQDVLTRAGLDHQGQPLAPPKPVDLGPRVEMLGAKAPPPPQFKPHELSAPPTLTASSKPGVNDANNAEVKALHQLATTASDGPSALTALQGYAVSSPSKHVKAYRQQLIGEIQSQMTTSMPAVTWKIKGNVTPDNVTSTLQAAFPQTLQYTETFSNAANRIGRYGILGQVDQTSLKKIQTSADTLPPVTYQNGNLDLNQLHTESWQVYNQLTASEKQVLKQYTNGSYLDWNNIINSGNLTPDVAKAMKATEKAMIELPPGTVLGRGFGFSGPDSAKNMNALLKSKGKVLQDFGITSTAYDEGWNREVKVRYKTLPGARGLFVDYVPGGSSKAITSCPGEREFMLSPKARVLVTRVESKNYDKSFWGYGSTNGKIFMDVLLLPEDPTISALDTWTP